jgi:AMP-polyphosphate phosphotransferase
MSVLDRSWYRRVLVERVEGPTRRAVWERAYEEVVQLETGLAAEGMVLVKLWLHLSPQEQLRRFEARRDDPYEAWKPTEDDWRNGARRGCLGSSGDHRPTRHRRPRGARPCPPAP